MNESVAGRYQVLGRLGAGGMGEVFLGHDPRLQRKVALKRLAISAADDAESRARILHEARAAARLNHPNIAAVYDAIETDTGAFIVMEYVEGVSLSTRLHGAPLPPGDVIAIGGRLASALAAAHEHGVIHRDLKPSNVQLTPDGVVKVLDFGVAKTTSVAAGATASSRTTHAMTSVALGNAGTPAYMAPEQLFGRPVDHRADLYALGVVLFEMATGHRPYAEEDAVHVAIAMSTRPAPRADAVNPAVPRPLADIIARALEHEPDRRFTSAIDVERALAAAAAATSPRTPAPRRSPHARSKLAAACVVLAVLAIPLAWKPLARRTGSSPSTQPQQPVVMAILPIENPSGDARAEYLGAGIVSLVSENLGSVPGVTVLSRAATLPYQNQRGDMAALRRDLGADYVLDLTVTAGPRPTLRARLQRPGAASPEWQQTLAGDPLGIEKQLLVDLGHALDRAPARQRLTPADWARIEKVPTTSGAALLAYSEAQVLLNRTDAGNDGRAVDLLQRATAADPQFAAAWAALGDAWWARFQVEKDPAFAGRATEAVQHAIALDVTQAQVHYSLGNMEYQTGNYAGAIRSLERAIQLRADFDDARRLLGRVLADSGRVDDAIAQLREAIRLGPRNGRNYAELGFVLYNGGRYAEALDAYHRTSELQPTDPGAYQMLGVIYYILGDLDQAIGNYEHAVRVGPTRPGAYANLGLAYYDARRYDEALAAYQGALARDPNRAVNHRNIGDVLARLNRRTDARAAYAKAIDLAARQLAINPRDVDMLTLTALCEAKLGRSADAEGHIAEALALGPTSRIVLQRSAEVHALLSEPKEALKYLAAAIEHGYDRRIARANDDLASLRNTAEFQQLVGNAAAAVPPTRR